MFTNRLEQYQSALEKSIIERMKHYNENDAFQDEMLFIIKQFTENLSDQAISELLYFQSLQDIINDSITRYSEPFYIKSNPNTFTRDLVQELFLCKLEVKMLSLYKEHESERKSEEEIKDKRLVHIDSELDEDGLPVIHVCKWNDLYKISGTNVVFDLDTQTVYGYIDNDIMYHDRNKEVEHVCEYYHVSFCKK